MKIFHKDADYAARTLIYLAMRKNPNYVSATALAKQLGLPLNFLRRICSKLIKAGYLDSREGSGGGVRLAAKPEAVSILELIELFHGPPEISNCTFRQHLCPNRRQCILRKHILEIEDYVKRKFRTLTLAKLIDEMRSGE